MAQFAENKKKGQRGCNKFFKKLDKDKKKKDPEHDREPPPSGSKQVIHVILGGPEGGDSTQERSSWVRDLHVSLVEGANSEKRTKVEPITFIDRDLPDNADCATEALVVKIDINGVDVRRVMVVTSCT